MSGIYQILNTAKEGLLASQIALGVTGANVTNASTPGYVRQRAVLAAKSPGEVADNAVQTGVEVTTIERLYNRFIEFQLVDQASQVGESGIRKETLERVEALFNETDGGGLNELMSRFWSAWEDLSGNPTGRWSGRPWPTPPTAWPGCSASTRASSTASAPTATRRWPPR